MTPERWQQIEEVFQEALDRAPQERAAFLHESCAGDLELQTEASSLVSAHDAAVDFIEEPAMARDAHLLLSDHPQSNIGCDIGPYKVIGRLGGGGMGEVYLAEDTRLNRRVALKILPAYFVSDEARLRRFQREARAASALNHPNILTIHEVGALDDLHFIATEFIDGHTIRELIATNDLSLKDALDIVIQVASALSAAHAAGIVHRDIKPENIMRRSDGIVKLLDFGIAKLLEQTTDENSTVTRAQTETGVVLGTVGYMSPEQARALTVDERTDIWSLGVVLYEMLTSRAPFTGATRMDTVVAILDRDPSPLCQPSSDSLPALPRLQNVIDKTLHKDCAERYQTALELLTELSSVRQQLDVANEFSQQLALSLMRGAEQFQGSEASTKIVREPIALHSYADSETNGHRRYGLMILSLIALAVVIGGIFAYKRPGLPASNPEGIATTTKLYLEMTQAEQLRFVDVQEQRISAMMGDRPARLNDEALQAIKVQVDRYAARQDSTPSKAGDESLNAIYSRAVPFVPMIARAFTARKIPIVIGIYLPMIESGYRPCYENSIGAKGLFQFLPSTAKNYGVEPGDMCDVEKMTPAAAHYIADRMAELGDDSQSMTLVLLSYNRGPDGVRDALRTLRETDTNYERNFWTLYANRDKLDDQFRNESAAYVPAFFAAAIVGEDPKNFGLRTPALSTLASSPGQ